MTWQAILFLQIITAYVVYPVIAKKLTDTTSKIHLQHWMYIFCLFFAFGYLAWTRDFTYSPAILIIIIIGVINSIGVYCNLRAINISLSKTSVFAMADDIIAMMFGYVFLSELKFLTPPIIIGILLSFSGATLLYMGKNRIKSSGVKLSSADNKKLVRLVMGSRLIWGIAIFFMRYFALSGLSVTEFIVSWYAGAWIGSFILFLLFRRKGKKETIKIDNRKISYIAVFSFLTVLAMFLAFKVLELAPITIIQPIILVSEMILPLLIGLFIFKEARKLERHEKLAFIIGWTGIAVIAAVYYLGP